MPNFIAFPAFAANGSFIDPKRAVNASTTTLIFMLSTKVMSRLQTLQANTYEMPLHPQQRPATEIAKFQNMYGPLLQRD